MGSADSFQILLQNLTSANLTPLDPPADPAWGKYQEPDGAPAVIAPWSEGDIPQAFAAQGRSLAPSGTQGVINYNVNSLVMLQIQFNSNYAAQPGDYFYIGLQPQQNNPGGDTSGYYIDQTGFPVFPGTQTAFVCTVIVGPAPPPSTVSALTVPTLESNRNTLVLLYLVNSTKQFLTINNVTSPLDDTVQPTFASTLLPPTTATDPVLFCVAETNGVLPSSINCGYNLPGGVVMSVAFNQSLNLAPVVGFSGSNAAAYTCSTQLTTTTANGQTTVTGTVTLAPA